MVGLLSMMYPRVSDEGEAGILQSYFIPGPSVFYDPKDTGETESGGDRVRIRLGNFLDFTGCYLKTLDINVENSFSLEGYPHNVTANVSFEVMDASYVENGGEFLEKGFSNPAYAPNAVLDGLKDVGKSMADAAGKTAAEGAAKASGALGTAMSTILEQFGIKSTE
jgi:hypothetical protein